MTTEPFTLDDLLSAPSEQLNETLDFLESVADTFRARFGEGWRIEMQLALMGQRLWWAAAPRLRQFLMALVTDSPELHSLDEGEYMNFEWTRILESLRPARR